MTTFFDDSQKKQLPKIELAITALKKLYDVGYLTDAEFVDHIEEYYVVDKLGYKWTIGLSTGKWHYYDEDTAKWYLRNIPHVMPDYSDMTGILQKETGWVQRNSCPFEDHSNYTPHSAFYWNESKQIGYCFHCHRIYDRNTEKQKAEQDLTARIVDLKNKIRDVQRKELGKVIEANEQRKKSQKILEQVKQQYSNNLITRQQALKQLQYSGELYIDHNALVSAFKPTGEPFVCVSCGTEYNWEPDKCMKCGNYTIFTQRAFIESNQYADISTISSGRLEVPEKPKSIEASTPQELVKLSGRMLQDAMSLYLHNAPERAKKILKSLGLK